MLFHFPMVSIEEEVVPLLGKLAGVVLQRSSSHL